MENNGFLIPPNAPLQPPIPPTVVNTGNRHNNIKKDDTKVETNAKDNSCSYTAMIAQAIMRTSFKRATLSEIYTFMTISFEVLKKRGNGWRNCVRHTLSLNECFVKLNRPENGRSCNWTIHPSYFDAFMRGDYRKRRSNRKKMRTNTQHWANIQESQRYMTSCYNEPMNGFPPYITSSTANETLPQYHSNTSPHTSHPMWQNYLSSLDANHKALPSSQEFTGFQSSPPIPEQQNGHPPLHHPPICNTEHKHYQPTSHSPAHHNFSAMSFPTTPSSSPTSSGHASPDNITNSSVNNDRFRSANVARTIAPPSGFSPYLPSKINERNSCETYCSSERAAYERALAYEGMQPSQHFQVNTNSTCYGNITSRPYRAEYF
uniref:Forkhead box protein n=1 Tax=Clytia hemisphaerica TaxID=252671 RepID=A0A069DN98_9CNID